MGKSFFQRLLYVTAAIAWLSTGACRWDGALGSASTETSDNSNHSLAEPSGCLNPTLADHELCRFLEVQTEIVETQNGNTQTIMGVKSYDAHGRMLTEQYFMATHPEHPRNAKTYTYDSVSGELLKEERLNDFQSDGIPEQKESTEYSYANGKLQVTSVQVVDISTNTVTFTKTTTHLYPTANQRQTITHDSNGKLRKVTEDYDGQGRLIKQEDLRSDANVPDLKFLRVTYFSGGNPSLDNTSFFDLKLENGDFVQYPRGFQETKGEFDAAGRQVKTVEETFDKLHAITKRISIFFTYDEKGQLIKKIIQSNQDADDSVEGFSITENRYDEFGNNVESHFKRPTASTDTKSQFKRLYEILGQAEPQVGQ